MAGPVKRSTFLVGLQVAQRPREALMALYGKTLSALKELPKDSSYRTHTEAITSERMNIVEKETNVLQIENIMKSGQIEEVIEQAEDELSLVSKMNGWEPWKPLESQAPEGQWKWP